MATVQREEKAVDYMINDAVKNYVFDLHDASRRSMIQADVDKLYGEFTELSDKYFSDKSPWPSSEAIQSECNNDQYFLCYYKEMTYRHLFLRGKPVLQDQLDAWENYCSLFDTVLAADEKEISTNAQWAFEIIHEFVYQFQSFCQFRTDLSRREAEEIEVLEANPNVWAASRVIGYLRRLSKHHNESAPSPTHHHLGYFAIFGLSRLECLLGDYHACLDVLKPVDLFGDHCLFHDVFACQVQVFYHVGLSYLMLRRYKDAIKSFSQILSHIYRLTKSNTLSYVNGGDQAGKMADKMCALLAIVVHLAPGAQIDDLVLSMVKDRYQDRMTQLSQGFSRDIVEILFEKACPKFIVPSIPNYEKQVNFSQDVYRRQVFLFLKQASAQSSFAKIRSYLKLYTAMSIPKLARFDNISDDDLRSELLAIKRMMHQTEREASDAPLDGTPVSALDVHFYVNDMMIHIDEAERVQRHESFFMSQIHKCEEVSERLQRS